MIFRFIKIFNAAERYQAAFLIFIILSIWVYYLNSIYIWIYFYVKIMRFYSPLSVEITKSICSDLTPRATSALYVFSLSDEPFASATAL